MSHATLLLAPLLLVATPLWAQQAHDHGTSPYVGMEVREIKALSEVDVQSLLAGEGMSLALAAELNGYPGPRHVLELADSLALTPDQREAVAALASLQGELRAAHLAAHIAMRDLLTTHQVHRYSELRGYGSRHGHKRVVSRLP